MQTMTRPAASANPFDSASAGILSHTSQEKGGKPPKDWNIQSPVRRDGPARERRGRAWRRSVHS